MKGLTTAYLGRMSCDPSGTWEHPDLVRNCYKAISHLCVCVCVCVYVFVCVNSLHSCLTLCDPMDYSLPGFLVHGILQARTLEWVAIHLQGIFPTQGSNLCLLHIPYWKAGSLPLESHEKQRFSLPVFYYGINLWDSFSSSPRFWWHMKSSVLPSPSQYSCKL